MNSTTSLYMQRGNSELQDRAEILRLDTRTVFVVADGADGIGGGTQAAGLLSRSVRDAAAELTNSEDCGQLLQALAGLVARKLAGPEKSSLADADIAFHESEYHRLRAELQAAHESSRLPDLPSEETRAALKDLLIRIRLAAK